MYKNLLYRFKKFILELLVAAMVVMVANFMLALLNGSDLQESFFVSISVISVVIVIGFIYLFMLSLYKINLLFNESKTEEWRFDIPYDYSPSFASFLLDGNIENTIEMKAVKIYLLLKGYFKLDKYNQYICTDKDIKELKEHEKNIYETVMGKTVYNSEVFKRYLFEDMEKENLIKKKKVNKNVEAFLFNFIIIAIYCTICFFGWEILGDFFLTAGVLLMLPLLIIILPIITAYKYNEYIPYKKTSKGKSHAKEWKKFKNFIQKYTLIEEKTEEHYLLLGEYIPYAIALGLADKIEKDFFKDLENEQKIMFCRIL